MWQVILTTAPIAIELALKIKKDLAAHGANVSIQALADKTILTDEESKALIDKWVAENPA
jgi:hypothetical protein